MLQTFDLGLGASEDLLKASSAGSQKLPGAGSNEDSWDPSEFI